MAEKQQEQGNGTNLGGLIPWIFFFQTFARNFGQVTTNQFMQLFMTDYAMMQPFVLATVLAVGQVIDNVLSFVAGGIVQKANFKSGPYRTWILMNGPLLTLGVFLIFLNPNIPQAGKIAVFVIGYLFRNVPQNFIATAQNTLVSQVAGTNMNGRLTLTSRLSQGSNASMIITNFVSIYLINFFNNLLGVETGRGYLVVGVGYCLIQTAFQVWVYRALSPYDQYDPDLKKVESSSVNTKVSHMYLDTFRNIQVWIVILMYTIRTVASSTLGPMTAYVFRYSINDITRMSPNGTAGSIAALVVSFLIPPVAKKLGKKMSQITANLLVAAGYVFMAMFGHQNPLVLITGTVWVSMSSTLSAAIGINNYSDAAEYQLWKTGRDSRPFIMSLHSITLKIGRTLSSFIIAGLLVSCGYQALGAGKAIIDAQVLVRNLYGFMAIMYLLSAVVMSFFAITDEKAKEYAEENRRREQEARAAIVQ